MDRNRYIRRARRANGVEREVLEEMVRGLLPRERVLLLGWSDYAKHLVNLFPDNIVAIAEDRTEKVGWSFRNRHVVTLDHGLDLNPGFIAITDVERRVDLFGEVAMHPKRREVPIGLYPGPHREDLRFYRPWLDDPFYRSIDEAVSRSMLDARKILFMVECLGQTLVLDGDVLEIGVWQGGSALVMAEFLRHLGVAGKKLVMMDLFEKHDPTHPDGIMCMDEMRQWFAAYEWAELHEGDADLMEDLVVSRRYCFIHYDMGFSRNRLRWCFESLLPGGILLLDNFGHVRSNPRVFQEWFAARGHRVGLTPFSEQGWVVKHADVSR